MRNLRVSMRWWLALAFALIAVVTAVAVASVFAQRSDSAFRKRAKDLVAGNAFVASEEVMIATLKGQNVHSATVSVAKERTLKLLVVDQHGKTIASAEPAGTRFAPRGLLRKAISSALDGGRFIGTTSSGREIVVGVPLRVGRFGAVVAQGSRPELPAELGIVRRQIVEAALLAVLVGALSGLVVATLIARRLRRIAVAAAEIEQGNFGTPIRSSFRDELGSLAETVNRMRSRLQESFARLEEERNRLHQLLDRLHEGVLTVERDGTVQFANRVAARLLARPLHEGQRLPDPWENFSLRTFARRLFDPDAAIAQERVSPDGERVYTVIGIPAKHGSETAIVVLADVSERESLELAEREFVANASHELRTPLTTIVGAVEALQSGAKEEPAERDRFLNLIERESGRLARLARSLLVLARAQTREELPRLTPVDIRPLLEELAAGVERRPAVSVEVECPAGVRALADGDLTEQALRNLVENAAKYTDQGRIVLSARRDNGSVVIRVSDSGRGMSPERQRRIFERFYRGGGRDPDGFGLGLAIVRQAVQVLGGDLDLQSRPGHGTTVSVSLPAAPEERR